MFFAANVFVWFEIIQTQDWRTNINYEQKISWKHYKTQIKILANTGLA